MAHKIILWPTGNYLSYMLPPFKVLFCFPSWRFSSWLASSQLLKLLWHNYLVCFTFPTRLDFLSHFEKTKVRGKNATREIKCIWLCFQFWLIGAHLIQENRYYKPWLIGSHLIKKIEITNQTLTRRFAKGFIRYFHSTQNLHHLYQNVIFKG